VSFDDPEKGMTEVELATKDTPDGLKRALADDARKRGAAAAGSGAPVMAGSEKRGLFGWLKRG
jgi:molecular chaperone DnaK